MAMRCFVYLDPKNAIAEKKKKLNSSNLLLDILTLIVNFITKCRFKPGFKRRSSII